MSAIRKVLDDELERDLSPAEIEILTNESPSAKKLRLDLEAQLYEAEHARDYFQGQIDTFPVDVQLRGLIKDFADWSCKLALIRDRIERFGFRRRLGDR